MRAKTKQTLLYDWRMKGLFNDEGLRVVSFSRFSFIPLIMVWNGSPVPPGAVLLVRIDVKVIENKSFRGHPTTTTILPFLHHLIYTSIPILL